MNNIKNFDSFSKKFESKSISDLKELIKGNIITFQGSKYRVTEPGEFSCKIQSLQTEKETTINQSQLSQGNVMLVEAVEYYPNREDEYVSDFGKTKEDDWTKVRYTHIPSGKIYKLNGAGGIIPVDGSTTTSLPIWLLDNSKDFIRI